MSEITKGRQTEVLRTFFAKNLIEIQAKVSLDEFEFEIIRKWSAKSGSAKFSAETHLFSVITGDQTVDLEFIETRGVKLWVISIVRFPRNII